MSAVTTHWQDGAPAPAHTSLAEAGRKAEESADRLHAAVAALQNAYDRQDAEEYAS